MKFSDKLKFKKNKEEKIKNLNDMPDLKDDESVIDSLDLEDIPDRKTKGYDTYYKKKINKKKLITYGSIIALIILLIVATFAAVKILTYEQPVDVQQPVEQLSEMEKLSQSIKTTITQGYTIGTTTKEEIISSGLQFHNDTKSNYLIKKDYTQINEIDHLTTYIFENNILTAIVHEALLDNSTKYKLSTYFQNFSSYINVGYKNLETSERWFEEPQKYNVENWNNSIINNNLELISEFTEDNDYIKIVASGVPYVDFLMSTRNDQNFGNLTIFYTNKDNSEKFKVLENIKFE